MKNPKTKVSVIIPVKNCEEFVEQALEDILGQTLQDIEVIVVYDTSSDGTLQLLNKLTRRDKRLRILMAEGNGPGSARNLGMAAAQGEYLIFLDSDDRFASVMLERLYMTASATKADICICRAVEFKNENLYRVIWDSIDSKLLQEDVTTSTVHADRFFQMFTGWAWDKLFRRAFCQEHKISFGNNFVLEDGCFVLPAMACADKIVGVKDILVYHRKHVSSLEASSVHFNIHWRDLLDNSRSIRTFLRKESVYKSLEKSYENWLLNYSLWLLKQTNGDEKTKMAQVLSQTLWEEAGLHRYAASDFYNQRDRLAYKYMMALGNKNCIEYPKWQRIWGNFCQLLYKVKFYGLVQTFYHLTWKMGNADLRQAFPVRKDSNDGN